MGTDTPRPSRHEEMAEILERKAGGVREVRDEADRYTVLGAAERSTFASWLTPIEEHFVCHRNDIPDIDEGSWTISLSGGAEGRVTVAELKADYPTVAVAHTMECAGNGRGQHDPETGSVQWDIDAAATAVWTGTPVSSVLRDHGVDDSSSGWLTTVGGDPPADDAVFARSIPLGKAFDDCVLAFGMNGRPLPPEHGHPVRLIVPGWYGVNNVKWVEELRVMDAMVTEGSLDRPGTHAHWQQESYRLHPPDVEPAVQEDVAEVDVEAQLAGAVEHPYAFDATVMSVIGRPDGTEPVAPSADGRVEVLGVAWAGDDVVERVELSTDGGASWSDAALFGPDYGGAWRLFRFDWDAEAGSHTLYSRATDEHGRRQPRRISDPTAWRDALERDEFPWNEGGYAANAYEPNGVAVEVVSPTGRD